MCAAGLHAVGLARLGRATVLGQEWAADGGGGNRTRIDRKWGEGLSFVWDQQILRETSGNSGGQALGKVVIVYECEGAWVGVCGGDLILLPIPAVSFSSWVLGHTQ